MTTTTTTSTMTAPAAPAAGNEQAQTFRRLRDQLACLKLGAAAGALPGVLDAARDEHLPVLDAIERLLGIEAQAAAARKLTSRLHFAALPARGPSMTTTSPPSPAPTSTSSASSPPCGSPARPRTWS